MRSTVVRLLLPVLLVAAMVAPIQSADSAALPVKFLDCNTIYGNDPGEGSFRLGNNLDCTTPGLRIDASNITVDLGGHRISGDGTDNGLTVFTSSNVTVKNGVVDDFDFNVLVGTSESITLQNLLVMRGNTATSGLEVQNGSGHRVINNTLVNDGALRISNGATDSVISGNTLVNSHILVSSDENKISSNRIFGATAAGITVDDGSERNVIAGNTVVGTDTSGIFVTGNDADDNVIKRNVVKAQTDAATGQGILVTEADRTRITGNTATANRIGIATTGIAEDTTISGNNVSANTDEGIEFAGSNSSGQITENIANENGSAGITTFGSNDVVIRDNTVNFNGYLNGLNDNSSPGGIDAPLASGGGNNKARGNDVAGPECDPIFLCDVGPTTPPPLIACDVPLAADTTLHHPMVCATQSAIRINGSGFAVNMGPHVVDGGAIGAEEAAVQVEAASSDITLIGGVLMNSENGVNLRSPASAGPHDITIRRSLIVNNDAQGVLVQGQDLTPGSSTATAGRARIERSTIGINGANNIVITEAPENVVTGNTLVDGNSVIVERSVQNVVTGNTIIGGSTGVVLSNNVTTDIPTDNTVSRNRIVGAGGRGVDMQDAVDNAIKGNTIIGTGTNAGDGIRLVSNTIVGGSQDNTISGNKVSGGAAEGISLLGESSGNRITRNVFRANHLSGITVFSDAEANVLKENRADENGADGASDAGIRVFDPVDGNEDPDVLVDNVAVRNGFLNEAAGDDLGLGINAGSDTDGNGNVATRNDDPDECLPVGFC